MASEGITARLLFVAGGGGNITPMSVRNLCAQAADALAEAEREREEWKAKWQSEGHEAACQNARANAATARAEAAERRISLLESLLACYRTGRRPSEKLLDALAALDAAVPDAGRRG